MDKLDYASFEVAKKLRENGFDEPCRASILIDGTFRVFDGDRSLGEMMRTKNEYIEFLAPTLYEAQKWLMKQGVFIEIKPCYNSKYEIIEYEYMIATYFDLMEKRFKWRKSKEYYEKYEQCLNGAILEALDFI